jgi:hypothetical protein
MAGQKEGAGRGERSIGLNVNKRIHPLHVAGHVIVWDLASPDLRT